MNTYAPASSSRSRAPATSAAASSAGSSSRTPPVGFSLAPSLGGSGRDFAPVAVSTARTAPAKSAGTVSDEKSLDGARGGADAFTCDFENASLQGDDGGRATRPTHAIAAAAPASPES